VEATLGHRRSCAPRVASVPTGRPSGAVRKGSLVTLLAGVILVAYFALKLLDVEEIGDPTDIGGGAILLVGYALTAVGAVLIARDFLRFRSSRRWEPSSANCPEWAAWGHHRRVRLEGGYRATRLSTRPVATTSQVAALRQMAAPLLHRRTQLCARRSACSCSSGRTSDADVPTSRHETVPPSGVEPVPSARASSIIARTRDSSSGSAANSTRSRTASPARSARVWCGASGHGGSCSQLPHSATVMTPPGARSSAPGSIDSNASCANRSLDMCSLWQRVGAASKEGRQRRPLRGEPDPVPRTRRVG
jgi:hypothetical protein